MHVLVVGMVALAVFGAALREFLVGSADLATASTVFSGIFVQAIPFLALGIVISALVAAFVTPERLARWLPRRPAAAILAAGVGGAGLPGCECGSVPVARRLFGDGAVGAAALTFMLAAPAINPVVLVATAVAFPGQPQMAAARCIASLVTALIMGALWARIGRTEWVTRSLPKLPDGEGSRWTVFTEAARHDFLQAASYLVIGAAAAAALRVIVPPWMYEKLAGQIVLGIVTMALLAVVRDIHEIRQAVAAAVAGGVGDPADSARADLDRAGHPPWFSRHTSPRRSRTPSVGGLAAGGAHRGARFHRSPRHRSRCRDPVGDRGFLSSGAPSVSRAAGRTRTRHFAARGAGPDSTGFGG